MQDNLLQKWNITKKELKEYIDMLCNSKSSGIGGLNDTKAMLAIVDLLTNGDITDGNR